MVTLYELVPLVFGMLTQLVPIPELRELVCACNHQPVWSAGQDKVSVLPLTVAMMLVGMVLTGGTTSKLPEPAMNDELVVLL